MPRNVRNFWIDVEIDGRNSTLSGGPRSKEDGFQQTIYIRNRGRVETALRIYGYEDKGFLRLEVEPTQLTDKENMDGFIITTQR